MNRQYNPKSLENIKPHQFKPKWKSGKTKLMRLPIALEEDILTYTRVIDSGVNIDKSSKSDVTTDKIDNTIEVLEAMVKFVKAIQDNTPNDYEEESDVVRGTTRVLECLKLALEAEYKARNDASSSD